MASGADTQMVFGGSHDSIMTSNDRPSLADALTINPELGIFYSYLRESTSLGQRLVNPAMSSTIFAPTDAVIVSMTRKPHQGPATADSDSDRILSTEDEQERAGYLERWVQRHVVAGGDIDLSEGVVVETLAGDGTTIRFVVDAAQAGDADGDNDNDWRKVTLLPGNAKIVDKKECRDGQLYVIDGALQ